MADTAIAITAGAGTNVDTRTEATNGNHRQVVVLGDPNTNAGVAPVDGTTGLAVNVTNAALTVNSHAVTNAGTFAVQNNAATPAGNNNIGDVDIVTVPTDPFGANADAASVSGSISAKLRAIATAIGSTAWDLGIGTGGSRTQRVAIDSAQIAANTAPGTDATALVGIQGAASMSPIAIKYADSANIVSGAITTAMTGTTSTSLVAAPGASLRNYITTIVVSNSHATVGTDVIIQDGSGGTTLMTIPAAAVYGGAVINLPVPLRQPTTNTALFCANVTTGSSTKVSAVGFKAA